MASINFPSVESIVKERGAWTANLPKAYTKTARVAHQVLATLFATLAVAGVIIFVAKVTTFVAPLILATALLVGITALILFSHRCKSKREARRNAILSAEAAFIDAGGAVGEIQLLRSVPPISTSRNFDAEINTLRASVEAYGKAVDRFDNSVNNHGPSRDRDLQDAERSIERTLKPMHSALEDLQNVNLPWRQISVDPIKGDPIKAVADSLDQTRSVFFQINVDLPRGNFLRVDGEHYTVGEKVFTVLKTKLGNDDRAMELLKNIHQGVLGSVTIGLNNGIFRASGLTCGGPDADADFPRTFHVSTNPTQLLATAKYGLRRADPNAAAGDGIFLASIVGYTVVDFDNRTAYMTWKVIDVRPFSEWIPRAV